MRLKRAFDPKNDTNKIHLHPAGLQPANIMSAAFGAISMAFHGAIPPGFRSESQN